MKRKQRRASRLHEQVSVDQIEQRERRRKRLPVEYTAEFDLLAEVHDILTPLADRIAAEQSPLSYRPYIDNLAAAVQAATDKVADLVAAADARRAAAHLPIEQRGRAVTMLRQLAVRPTLVSVTDAEIISRTWVSVLSRQCSTYSGPLSHLLSMAAPTETRRAAPATSETLIDALRVLDQAAVDTARQLDRVAFLRHELPTRIAATGATSTVRAELAALGITR